GAPIGASPSSILAIRQCTEDEAILRALERNGYNRLATARELGIHKTTLFRKLKRLKLRLPDADGRTALPSKHKTSPV
ncbi:MAG: helix-turn-helix domain-containing protein, partial [Syntrophobacteraceae bacterium]